jgi:hypothetical protein
MTDKEKGKRARRRKKKIKIKSSISLIFCSFYGANGQFFSEPFKRKFLRWETFNVVDWKMDISQCLNEWTYIFPPPIHFHGMVLS